jgi:membrane protease YdiL (CAAX protease family)
MPWRQWLGSVALGVAGLPLAWMIFWIQARLVPVNPEVVSALNRQLLPSTPTELGILLFAAAITPAVCEEFVFRGLLQRGLAERIGAPGAVFAAAALFGLLHWEPGGGFRILPTVGLGLLLGWAAWRTGSLLAAMTVHFTHNLLILLVSTAAAWSDTPPPPDLVPGAPPLLIVAGGVALAALGSQLLAPSPPLNRPPRQDPEGHAN